MLPRSIASFAAFENAMTLDIAMGGSTNTVLHLLAAAHEAGVDFTMADIDRLSRRVPCSARSRRRSPTSTWRTSTAPAASWRSSASSTAPGSSTPSLPTVHAATLGDALDRWDVMRTESAERPRLLSAPHPAACRRRSPSARSAAATSLDLDREKGVIRSAEHAFSKDGGLAVLYGNLAESGAS